MDSGEHSLVVTRILLIYNYWPCFERAAPVESPNFGHFLLTTAVLRFKPRLRPALLLFQCSHNHRAFQSLLIYEKIGS